MINKTSGVLLLFLFVLSLIATTHILAQKVSQDNVVINTNLVITWAQIVNSQDGSPIMRLALNDFLLREENKAQQIVILKEGQPLSVMILIDGMTCLRPSEIEFRRSREALRQLGDDAEIALMAWDSDVRLIQPFTRNQRVIANQLEDRVSFFTALNGIQNDPVIKVRPQRTNARPGEAVYQALSYLEKASSFGRRKIIILISSTSSSILMDRTHPHSSTEVVELLSKSGATVYALLENDGVKEVYGLSEKLNPFSISRVLKDSKQRRAGGTIQDFIEQSGGTIFNSKNNPWKNLSRLETNLEFGKEFDELFIKLTSLIRSSYTIGYYPENTNFDGKFRRIKLELSKSGKAKYGNVDIKTREGYHAVRPVLKDVSEKSK